MGMRLLAGPLFAALALIPLAVAGTARADPLDPLYARIAADLKEGRPLVVTVHVALCDNRALWCGGGGLGRGDRPERNLYWGGAAGLRAYFDRARGWRRIFLDGGDGEKVLERVVYRHVVRAPSPAWRRLGVSRGFEVLLVGLAYAGPKIGEATDAFVDEVLGERAGESLPLGAARVLPIGARGHVVGYAGHNHLMDVSRPSFPAATRRSPIGFFALSCMNAPYLARALSLPPSRALLLTRSFMYPGAFTIDGLVLGLAEAEPQEQVYLRGVRLYAKFQKREERTIRWAFLHDGERRFRRLWLASAP